MKLVDMKRSKKDVEPAKLGKSAPMMDPYPYGLSITLGRDELRKLGITRLPSVGDDIPLETLAHVTAVEERTSADGGKRCEIRLELRKIAIDHDDSPEGVAKGALAAMDAALED